MSKSIPYSGRFYVLSLLLCIAVSGLIWRMVDLTVLDSAFLKGQGDARTLRTVTLPAYRGMITDRNGEPLAISTPVDSVWINPEDFVAKPKKLNQLATLLKMNSRVIEKKAKDNDDREFVYLKRALNPALAKKVKALDIEGVYLQREYRRYYPEGPVTAHLIGLTDIDDKGQEGLELAYNNWLSGISGKKRVLKDRLGRIVADVNVIREPKPGHNLVLSIDRRIQYLAFRVLQSVVKKYKAKSGSVVVLDAKTGEVLAMVNQPSFNPNKRPDANDGRYRNRAMTDVFEPGSVIKPFSVVSALDSGQYQPDSLIDTSPGWMMVGKNKVTDEDHDYGRISVTQVLKRSSNVGVTKMTLSLPAEQLWGLLHRVGFGERSDTGFPGEANGSLVNHTIWRPFALATLAFGYGIAVTPLQLAHAYEVLADHGVKMPISLLKRMQPVQGKRVIDQKVADETLHMLEAVVEDGGTGTNAKVNGYRVAGKTGTARIAGPNGYEKDHHIGSFVGIAPVSDPQLVIAVMVNDPQGAYYGSAVAAPAFAKIMGGALRILDIAPDAVIKRAKNQTSESV